MRAVKKGRSTYEPLDEKFNKEIDEMTQHERLEFDRIKEHGFISWVCGGCRLPRQHKPTCKFKRLPFSALVATTDNLDMVPKLFSTISTNSTTFPSPLQSNNVSSTSLPKISTSSSNFESFGLDSEGDNYDETFQEDDDEEEKVDRALNDIVSDYSNLFFEDYVKPLIIDDHGRCSAQACAKHHVYDWDFVYQFPMKQSSKLMLVFEISALCWLENP